MVNDETTIAAQLLVLERELALLTQVVGKARKAGKMEGGQLLATFEETFDALPCKVERILEVLDPDGP